VQLADVITSFRRHWRAAVGVVLLVGIGLGAFLFLRDQTRDPDRWLASVEILVPARDENGERPEGVPPMLLQGQSTVALSAATTGRALSAVGIEGDARDDVTFDYRSNERGDIITLSVTTPTEDQADALAGSYGWSYITSRSQAVASGSRGAAEGAKSNLGALQERFADVEAALQQVDPELLAGLPDTAEVDDEAATSGDDQVGLDVPPAVDIPATTPIETQLLVYERQSLLQRIEATRRAAAQNSTDVIVPRPYASIVERVAPENITPEPPTALIPIAVGIGVAVLLAFAVPVILDRIDHSIRDSHTAGSALAAPVLSTIPAPAPSRLESLARRESPGGHAYRTLATASVATDQLPRAIVVTAPVGQMQDTVAANFAAALADLGLRVVLVPTDRRQAWYADAPEDALTLPDFLTLAYTGRINGEVPHQLQPTPVDNLLILPHGDTGADSLIDGLPPLLRVFAEGGVDVTVIAAPSILEDPSATILAWSTRSVLWVVEVGEVTQQQASEAAARLELAGASPFGVAVVDGKG
jgi:Mrp family chromosome partitioning ATPase